MLNILMSSVADPGCLSRIPDPDFSPSRISDPPDPGSNQKGGGKFFFKNLLNFLPTKFELCAHDIRLYFLPEDDLREYDLREYDLREYNLHEYDLREYDLREYDLREYDLRE